MKSILNNLFLFFIPKFALFATAESTQYAQGNSDFPPTLVDANQWHGKLRFFEFDYTQSGIATIADTMAAIKLPAGKQRLILPLSRIVVSAGGASSTMDIGWEAYTDQDGTAVAADPDGLDVNIDTSGATITVPGGTLGAAETKLFDSRDGVTITLQVNDTAFPDTGTMVGYFVTCEA